MRRLLRGEYPESKRLTDPQSITDTISLSKLQEVRLQHDFQGGHGYTYATIGNDDWVDRWITDGINERLLTGFWQSDLERFARMDRGPANQILMDQLNHDEL